MMGSNTMTPADMAAVMDNRGYGNDMFGGGWMWIFVLLLLFRGGNWGYNGGESPLVSEEFIKRDIFNTNQNVSSTAAQTQMAVSNTACQTQRDVLENRYTTQLGLQQLGAAQAECCCNTQKEILQSRYDAALQAQAMQAQLANCCCDLKTAIHEEGEMTRGLIQSNTIQDLRDRLAERDRDLSAANFQISQVAQTSSIVNAVRPFPVPAYQVQSPYVGSGYGYGCGCANACGC